MAAKMPERRVLTALDIGTSKVAALVAEYTDEQKIHILGIGVQPSRGLKKGVIVNIENTIQAIQKAIEDAETMAGVKARDVCASIAGAHIQSFNSNGVVAIREREVSAVDIERVIDAAKAVAIPADQRILHILPQEFIIDNQDGIKEPVGMAGVRLEAKVHLISGSISIAQNIIKCVQHCGLEISDLVLQQLASSYAVLTDDEKELGVCMVDIGGGTADITIFTEGAIRHTSSIPIAGAQVTNDIAHALRIPTQYAEDIKIEHGVAMARLANPEDLIEVKGLLDRPSRQLSRQSLASVIEARYEEIFNLIYENLSMSGYLDHIASGIVLTGGASKIQGALELAEEVLRMPVRLGVPTDKLGLGDIVSDPIHATGVGLLLYLQQQLQDSTSPAKVEDTKTGTLSKMKRWFGSNF
jgi:cell division protein FtsA